MTSRFSLSLVFFHVFLVDVIVLSRNYDLSLINQFTISTSDSDTIITAAPTPTTVAYSWLNKTQSLLSLAYPLQLYIDPPEGHFSPTALGVFMRCISPKGESANARVYYTLDDTEPTKFSTYTTYDHPYVHVDTPFKVGRARKIRAICTEKAIDGNTYRSELITRHYIIEGSSRPNRSLF